MLYRVLCFNEFSSCWLPNLTQAITFFPTVATYNVLWIVEDMNSSATFQGWSTSPECEIYNFLGGKLDQPTTEEYAAFLFLIVMSIIACPITIALNALVIIAVKIKRRLRTRSNIALACLALTDELALIAHPIFLAVTVSALQGENSSKICTLQPLLKNTLRLLSAASLYHMVLMNFERYIAIKHSFAYETIVTEARIFGMSTITWIIVVIRIPLIIAGNGVYIQVSSILIDVFIPRYHNLLSNNSFL